MVASRSKKVSSEGLNTCVAAQPEDSPIVNAARLVTHPDAAAVTAISWTSSTGGEFREGDRIYTGTEEGRIKVSDKVLRVSS